MSQPQVDLNDTLSKLITCVITVIVISILKVLHLETVTRRNLSKQDEAIDVKKTANAAVFDLNKSLIPSISQVFSGASSPPSSADKKSE